MAFLTDLSYNIKKYYSFTKEEIRSMIIGILIVAFIFSFDQWGVETFDFLLGLRNFFNAVLIVTLAFLVHQSAQRIIAFTVGFKVEYRIWIYGLLIGLVLVVLSNGRLWFFAPGGILVYHMAGHRLGAFRYGLNYWPMGVVGIMGPVSNLLLATVFKLLLLISPQNALLQAGMVFNIWYAIFTMLPIPPLDGSHMFFSSRVFFVFSFTALVGWGLSLYFLGVFPSILIGLLIGVLCWLAYFWFIES